MAVKDIIFYSARRREFLKKIMGGAVAIASPLAAAHSGRKAALMSSSEQQSAPSVPVPSKIRRDGMVYRRLGRTGLYISEISLGGSPLPDESLLRRIIERGVNYIDTSNSYENGNSERKVGRLMKDLGRDKVAVHTRFHLRGSWTEETIIASVEGSLRRLDTDYVDVLGIHGVEKPEHLTDERVLGAFDKLKAQGKFRFRGLTCHVNQHTVIPKAVECGCTIWSNWDTTFSTSRKQTKRSKPTAITWARAESAS